MVTKLRFLDSYIEVSAKRDKTTFITINFNITKDDGL